MMINRSGVKTIKIPSINREKYKKNLFSNIKKTNYNFVEQ